MSQSLGIIALLLLAACGQSTDKNQDQNMQRGIDRSVADVEAAEAATAKAP